MAKIIQFKKPAKEEKPVPAGIGSIDFQKIFAAMPGLQNDFEAMGIELGLTRKIQEHLNSLRGRISNNALATSRSSLRAFDLEQLRNIARTSTPDQWTSKPAYFQALVDEIHSRNV